ncbi:MAG: response regulator [Candidatus Omnitrophica bacterium]|nr:response regulator [Candidatus Omnitrophota bacterium]
MAKILVIDDDKIIRERMASLLELEDHEPVIAEDGPHGLELFKKVNPAVILLDIKMPGMDGLEVLKKIKEDKERAADVEVIMITGHGGVDTAIEALKIGAFGYVQKPVEFDQLIIEISKALTKQKLEKDLAEYVKQLEIAKNKADDANQAKSRFLATMSHEIRTPLNAIIGFLDILRSTNLDEKQADYVNTISSSGNILLEIINDILDISKVESGEVKLESINFNLRNLLENLFKVMGVKKGEKPIDMGFSINGDVPLDIEADPTRIKQIIINILNNALKFTEKGSINLEISLEKELEGREKILRFTSTDTGVGIPKDKLEEIFKPFTQADMSTTRKYGGTGLGLNICKKLAELMGGEIWVESEEGKGSQFIFTIKIKEGLVAVNNDVTPLPMNKLSGKNVLILDDTVRNIEIFKFFCEETGMKVESFTDGTKAIKWLEEKGRDAARLDIILSDIMMPNMDGYTFANKVKSMDAYKDVKMIALSSDVYVGMSRKLKESGYAGFLPKPITREELRGVICTVLGDNRKDNENIVTRHSAREVSCKGLKILVAEDNAVNQKLIKALLENMGCIVQLAANGKDAVDSVIAMEHDIVLMDLQMPIMGGVDATIRIREIGKNIPIIALTAAAMVEDEKRAMDVGMNGFLTKPIDVTKLKDMIKKFGNRN